ncbi:hypothetical protein [Archangium gephyra]|uniref:Uncharacterized protein n=1 Tax=Archangium gephyra TaxID=48 RepID=A0AAC8QC87_9BACT|nr:hypothetical protein [Archangium gephyra]AKJ04568.1 Hypothetical protein AA314_06194 [Archangium gephyra]
MSRFLGSLAGISLPLLARGLQRWLDGVTGVASLVSRGLGGVVAR